MRLIHPQEDWSLCQNGTRHEGAVLGAVHDFAQQVGRPNSGMQGWVVHQLAAAGP